MHQHNENTAKPLAAHGTAIALDVGGRRTGAINRSANEMRRKTDDIHAEKLGAFSGGRFRILHCTDKRHGVDAHGTYGLSAALTRTGK